MLIFYRKGVVKMRIGFHFPFSGNLMRLKERISVTRGNTFQVFARSLRGGKIQKINQKQLYEFEYFLHQKNIKPIIVHAPYTYNLAKEGSEDIDKIVEDLTMAKKIGATYYILHPGYSKGIHPLLAVENVKENIKVILESTDWEGKILIKNMAGAGSELGYRLEEWNEMISFHTRVKGALDFSRLYAAGYDFTTSEKTIERYNEIEAVVGWEKIEVVYINDTIKGCGSRKNDKNPIPLGEGIINFMGYEKILTYPAIKDKIWIVENQPDVSYVDQSIEFLIRFHE
jgi:deoxyribonuclease-4